jgi:hypothetical protein
LSAVEVEIAFDGEAERTARFAKLPHADESNLRKAHAKVAEAVGDIVVAELGEEPGALRVDLPHGCGNGRRPRGESESRL